MKYKIVVSDFHIGRGRFLPDGRKNTLEDFQDDDIFIEFLEYHSTGKFAEAEVELIFNGDFFNPLQVDYKGQYVDLVTEEISMHKMEVIRQGHQKLISALARFCSSSKRNIVFVVGNHDMDLLWRGVQKQLRTWICNKLKFYSDFYDFDGVMITHGHRFEFINHFNPKQFWYEAANKERYMRLPWGSLFVIDFLSKMKAHRTFIDQIKPFRKYLRYALTNDFIFAMKMLYHIVRFWLKNRLHKDPVRRREFNLSLNRMGNAMSHETMFEGAERILRKTSYRIVVMGHSHAPDYRQFGAAGEFFNTGTWIETISMNIHNFGRNIQRTYLLIDYEEDPKKPRAQLKKWIGKHKVIHDVKI